MPRLCAVSDKPSESAEQRALFEWAAFQTHVIPELRWMFHIPNGGQRLKAAAGRLKAEGVKAGVWDVFLPAPRWGKAGLWIEMKVGRNTTSDLQNEFGVAMLEQGYACVVCYDWVAAKNAILYYLFPASTAPEICAH